MAALSDADESVFATQALPALILAITLLTGAQYFHHCFEPRRLLGIDQRLCTTVSETGRPTWVAGATG
jgi:hypothetical protein